MTVRYVLWDHDGVLVDTEPVFFEATARVLADRGAPFTHARWAELQANGQGIVRLIREAGLAADEPEIRRMRDRTYGELLAERDVLIEGATGVLARISARYPSVMVTTSLRRYVDQMHGGTGLLNHFRHVLTAEDCTRHKPHPEPYLRAMELLGATPDECVAIEDSPRGLSAARAAGLRCAVVRSRFMETALFPEAEIVLDSLGDFEAFVDRLAST
ncbi:MAG: HAD family phosphatase [Gemmatimonadota bacterium]